MESLEITLYDAFPQTVNVLNKQGGIYLEGAAKRSGFGKLLFASTDMNKSLMVLPSFSSFFPRSTTTALHRQSLHCLRTVRLSF